MLFAIPLAWLQLKREKIRLAVALAGIGFAVILMFMQLGFSDALFRSAVVMHERLNADIVLLSPQSNCLIAMKSFSDRRLYQTLKFPGVQSVSPMYIGFGLWKNPENRKTRQIMVLGVKPEDNAIELPGLIANAETIKKRDVLLFDEASRPEFGSIPTLMQQGKTVETEIDSQRIEVGGLFKLGSSFGADGNVIMSDLNFARLFQKRDRNLIDAGLIRTNPGMTPEQIDTLIAEMKKALPNDVTVLTKAGFTDFERSYWRDSTSIGFIFTLGAAMGFIVGIVVVYQILYTDVTDHLAEYATLKAMGYTNFYLLQVVFQEAFILSILGYLPGLLVCNALYDLVRNATSLPMLMTPERILQIFLLALVMCTISGAIAVRKVQEADPADIF
jgi:putative ABC transport system permease protein